MKLNIFLSSARKLEERESIKKGVCDFCSLTQHEHPVFHDCNEDDSAVSRAERLNKQNEYNKKILNETDVFIAVINADAIGEFTFQEIEVAYKRYCENNSFPLCMIFEKSVPVSLTESESNNSRSRKDLLVRLNEISQEKDDYTTHEINQKIKKPQASLTDSEAFNSDNPHFFVDYEDLADLQYKIGSEFKKIYKKGGFFLRRYSHLGEEIKPQNVMQTRGDEDKGYSPVYFRRKKIDEQLEKQMNVPLVIVTGKSGAGKSRALYEFIRTKLKKQHVINVNTDNFNTIYETLFHQMPDGVFKPAVLDLSTDYYLIFDEIDKLIFGTNKDRLKKLFEEILRNTRLKAYLTITTDSYDLLKELKVEELIRSKSSDKVFELHIKPLSIHDNEDKKIIKLYKDYFNIRNKSLKDTIGGYNPKLQEYIKGKISAFEGDINFQYFFKAYSIVRQFRINASQYLGITLKMANFIAGEVFTQEQIQKLLQKLINTGIITIYEAIKNEKDEIVNTVLVPDAGALNIRLRDYFFDQKKTSFFVAPKYIFTVDDIMWDAIQDLSFIASFDEEDRIRDLIDCFGDETDTYAKAITRAKDKSVAWKLVYNYYRDEIFMHPELKDRERQLFFNLFIEYANDLKTAISVFENTRDRYKDYIVSGDTVAAFLSRLIYGKETENEVYEYINQIEKDYPDLEKTSFLHMRSLEVTTSFDEAYGYFMSNKTSIESFFGHEMALYEQNARRCYSSLQGKVVSIDQYKKTYPLLQEKGITHDKYVYEAIISSAHGNKNELVAIFDFFFNQKNDNGQPVQLLAMEAEEELDEKTDYIIGNLIKYSPDFTTAYLFFNYLAPHQRSSRQMSQLFNKCRHNESDFNTAKRLLVSAINWYKEEGKENPKNTAIYFNDIFFNSLINQAPNHVEALDIIKQMRQPDEFTLNNFLKIVIKDYIKEKKRSKDSSIDKKYAELIQNQYIGEIDPNLRITAESSPFKNVAIDSYTICSIYGINDPAFLNWLEGLVEKNPELKKKLEENYVYYCSKIRHASDIIQLKSIYSNFTEKILNNPESNFSGEPDVFNSILSKVRESFNNVENREWVEKIILENEGRIFRDQHYLADYFSLFSEKVFNEQKDKLSEFFIREMDQTEIMQPYPFTILMGHICSTFREIRIVYDGFIELLHSKKQKTLKRPDEFMVSTLLYNCETEEQYHFILEEIKRFNLPLNESLTRKQSQTEKRLNINGGLKKDHSQNGSKENDVLKQVYDSGTVEEMASHVQKYIDTLVNEKVSSQLMAELMKSIRFLGKRDIETRKSETKLIKDFLQKNKGLYSLGLSAYNYMLHIYYPEEEKQLLYKALLADNYSPDKDTYIAFISDWACSIESNRRFFQEGKHLVKDKNTYNAYLKQELLHAFKDGDNDFMYVYDVIYEIDQLGMEISTSVFERMEKEFKYYSRNESLRQEYLYIDDVRNFIFTYISRYLTENQYAAWLEIAKKYGVELG